MTRRPITPPQRAPLKIRPSRHVRIAQDAAPTFAAKFPIAEPPPGVPRSVVAAMDSALSPSFDYAGGYGGDGYGCDAWLGFPYLASLMQRPEYRVIVETRAKEMTREGFELISAAADDETAEERLADLDQALKDFNVLDRLYVAAEHDGAFGGGHIYIDTGATDDPAELATPLVIDKAKIKKGGLKGFRNVEPTWVYPGVYNAVDPLAPDYFKPPQWYVNGKTVHRTRLLTLISREMPDLLKPAYSFRGLALSQMAKPYVDNWLRTRQSVSDLVHSFSVMILKSNIGAALQGASWDDVYGRADEFNALRDNRGTFIIDKDTEDFANVSTPLSGLDSLQAQSQEQLCSVSQTPTVKLLGIQPAGLNASSEGEIRVFYDLISALQEHLFKAPLKTMIECVQLHLWGAIDPDISFRWVPLWQLDDAAMSAVRKSDADTAAVYIESGVLSPEEERLRLANDKNGPWSGIDPDDVPEPPDMGEMDDSGNPAEAVGEPRSIQRSADHALDKEWNEADHPRGQPENAGQFGHGGGGGAPAKIAVKGGAIEGGVSAMHNGKTWSAPGIAPERIKALAIPPAWKDVRISHDPDAALQVAGRDSKGRIQRRYSEAFADTTKAQKFARIAKFETKAPALIGATQAAIEEGSSTAAAVRLMLLTGMRPGSETDTGAEKKAHGATNLRKSHVRVDGNTVHYDFIGKEGVNIKNFVRDATLAKFVSDRLSIADGDRLFNTDEDKARNFIKSVCGGDFKSKDLRTLKANLMARDLIAATEIPQTPKERRAAVNRVGDVVASQLGNTRVMALGSYINPMLFDIWGGADGGAKDANEDAVSEMERGLAGLREWINGVSFVGGVEPEMATADDDDGND